MSACVYLVGTGPGQAELVTPQAVAAIGRANVVIGHPECLALIGNLTEGKEIIADRRSPLERSQLAAEKAMAGSDVAIVSSGDPGIYAIAATFLDYLKKHKIVLDVKVLPGVGLGEYAAARLGAPLGNDFACITLTDRGIPWKATRRRLEAAAAADFVTVIYNPFGKIGTARLQKAVKLMAGFRNGRTTVGLLCRAATPQEKAMTTTLDDLDIASLPADTLVIIGNSQSYVSGGRMVTPRRYRQGIGY